MTQRQDPTLAITFLYYRDLAAAEAFWRHLGFPLVIDQGFAKIFQVADGAHVGLVDEARGMHDWHEQKCVQVCLRVRDVVTFPRLVDSSVPRWLLMAGSRPG